MPEGTRRREVAAAALVVLWFAAMACLIVGIVRMGADSVIGVEGGYSTSAEGAPAVAAVGTVAIPASSRTGLVVGVVLIAIAGALLAVGVPRRRREDPLAWVGASVFGFGAVSLLLAVAAVPRRFPPFDVPPDFPSIPVAVPGRGLVELGTVLALVAGFALLAVRFRPVPRDPVPHDPEAADGAGSSTPRFAVDLGLTAWGVLLLVAGIVAADLAFALLPRSDGDFESVAVGAPAYAAVFTSVGDARPWLEAGAILATVGGAVGTAGALRRWAPVAGAGLAALVVAIAVLAKGCLSITTRVGLPGPLDPVRDGTASGAWLMAAVALLAVATALLAVRVRRTTAPEVGRRNRRKRPVDFSF